ncbi:STAS domain-containing protein [Actinomadura sp. ATCC 31491]|uniref:Anti-sigma factor antagonist n=1 Tax=Actinomadura luzonensis TaxID=2805427 RepID=A0ABT0G2I2_9ACTN|nr:STAS domain-containing protein [Actinomadura luzonensis]MCK2218714.1 STAS domain-containing protein [Actinomadura luzonensis]
MSPSLTLTCRSAAQVTVIHVSGAVDSTTAPELDDYITAHYPGECGPELVVDMGEVPFLDSSGLVVLIRAHGLARERGGDLHLAAVQSSPAFLLALTGAREAIRVHDDVEAALEAITASRT